METAGGAQDPQSQAFLVGFLAREAAKDIANRPCFFLPTSAWKFQVKGLGVFLSTAGEPIRSATAEWGYQSDYRGRNSPSTAEEADSWPVWTLLPAYSESQMGLWAPQQPLKGILVIIETGPLGFLLKKSLDSIPSAHKPRFPS